MKNIVLNAVRVDQISGATFPIRSGMSMRKAMRMMRLWKAQQKHVLADVLVILKAGVPVFCSEPNNL